MRRAIGALVVVGLLAAAPPVAAAPIKAQGPPLSVPKPKLRAALQCTGDLEGAGTAPVMLAPATSVSPRENYSWNWQPALTELGIPWCAVYTPDHNMADIQVTGEYYAFAIRAMFNRAGRRVSIIGHSQGGMAPRWALRFWPDTRRKVDDMIGFAPSNHGTDAANLICAPGCAPSFWQQASGSNFLEALNSPRETFKGVSYTSVYTHLDEVVVPNADESGSSSLHTGAGKISNVAVQDVCPLSITEHLGIGTYDPVAYALGVDALSHPGPADPSRIDLGVCSELLMPGVDPITFATEYVAAAAVLSTQILTYPHVSAEPPLACYADPGCVSTQRQSRR